MDAIPEKPAVMPAQDLEKGDHEEEDEQRSLLSSIKSSLESIWYNSKFLFLGYSGSYLAAHWFDYFFYPWSLDYILEGKHVPYPLAEGLICSAIIWAWWFQGSEGLRKSCTYTGMVLAADLYHCVYWPEVQQHPFFVNSIFACSFLLLIALLGSSREPTEENCVTPATASQEAAEAARESKCAEAHESDPSAHVSHGRWHTGLGSTTRALASSLGTIRSAVLVALTATIATDWLHPSETTIGFLSIINCEAHISRPPLAYGTDHFEFIVTNRTGTFTRHCSEPQEMVTLTDAMWAHVESSKATCGVSCLRQTESGNLVGYISEVGFGLVDMHYCRGAYESFGPDCEAEGDDYGYDVSREEWMNDIGSPWSSMDDWLMSGDERERPAKAD